MDQPVTRNAGVYLLVTEQTPTQGTLDKRTVIQSLPNTFDINRICCTWSLKPPILIRVI